MLMDTDQAPSNRERNAGAGKAATSAVGKAFAILRALRRAPAPLTLTAIADGVGMAPSSAHSVLNQLLQQGAVLQDQDKRYQLGPSIFYLGSAFARGTRVYRSVWVELVSAANSLGVTSALAVPWDNHHLVLNAHRAGDSDVAVPFGGRVPIDAASWGKVYFAWSGEPLPKQLGAYTSRSVVDPKLLAKELERVRGAGYAVDNGEFADGVGGVAAPLTSDSGYEGLASFLAPTARVEELGVEVLGRRISTIAARASLALGDQDRMSFFGVE
jgi:DNA-binding IclR family transcriptional regulator